MNMSLFKYEQLCCQLLMNWKTNLLIDLGDETENENRRYYIEKEVYLMLVENSLKK